MTEPSQQSRRPGPFRRWWENHFTGFDRRESNGYKVWFFFAGLVLVPELLAAIWPKTAPFPTISGTVGALEYDHPILALVVTGVLVLCAYSGFRYPTMRTGYLPPHDQMGDGLYGEENMIPYRTYVGRRFTLSTTPVREFPFRLYFAFALAVILGFTTWGALTSDINDEYRVGQTLYGLTALFWVIVPSVLAWPKNFAADVPFPTLFSTVRSLERRLRIVSYLVAGGLVILLIHLVLYPWPSTIPDISRLHATYKCHPLRPAKPLTPKQIEDCKKRDEADNRPAPNAR
jgi:hypothetical protein